MVLPWLWILIDLVRGPCVVSGFFVGDRVDILYELDELESESEDGGKISDASVFRHMGNKATRPKGNKAIYSHRHLISPHPLHFIFRTTSFHPPFYLSFVDRISSLRSFSYIFLGFLFVPSVLLPIRIHRPPSARHELAEVSTGKCP